MKLIPYDDSLLQIWQDIAAEHGTVFHDIRWRDILTESYGLEPIYNLVEEGDQIVGILPYFQYKKGLVSLPFNPFAGLATAGTDTDWQRASEAATRLSGTQWAIHRRLADENRKGRHYVTMRKPLQANADATFDALKPRLRNKIRNAQKEDFCLEPATVDEYYPVYLKATNALGTPGHARRFFENIVDGFQQEHRLHNLHLGGKPVGTIFELDYAGIRYDLWIFSFREIFELQPNIWLYWNTLEDACGKGIHTYDFGRSIYGEGTYQFKKQWGAKPQSLDYHRFDADTDTWEEIEPNTGGKAPGIWKKLPGPIANFVGPRVRKLVV